MRKHSLLYTIAAAACTLSLAGCQKAPEAVEGNGIVHARGDMERQVQDIAAADTQEQAGTGAQQAGRYQGTAGTGGSRIAIDADIPAVPDQLYIITLEPDDGLDRDTLLALLDSESGSVRDTSQELLREIEENDECNETVNEYGERFLYSRFGDHSAARLGDGKKEASFFCHTGAYYIDRVLRETCFEIYSGDYSEVLVTQDHMDEGSFSAERAGEILMDRLRILGVSEPAFQKICYTEGGGYRFYYMEFVPVYDGIAVDIGSNAYGPGQVWPNGTAIVSEEGVAEIRLTDFCGKTAGKEPVTVLSFEQVLDILGQYLDNGMIESDGTITYDRVELNYYPVPNPAPAMDEIEYKSKLVLTPIWHIYVPIDEYVENYGTAVGPSHICVNAVTGELEAAE